MARSRIERANTALRARPLSLARYIAASASRSSDSADPRDVLAVAIPVLTVTTSSPPPQLSGCAIASPIRSAMPSASISPLSPSQRRTNSSPPKRASVSPMRNVLFSRSAIARSIWSPAAWPRLSLMSLKRSMSTNSNPRVESERSSRPRACTSRSSRRVRFGRSVSGSCSAWWASAISAVFCFVMSCAVPRIRTTSPPGPISGLPCERSQRSVPATGMMRWSTSKALRAPMRGRQQRLERCAVLRVEASRQLLEVRGHGGGEAVQASQLLGPLDLAGDEVELPAPELRDPLCLGQRLLAPHPLVLPALADDGVADRSAQRLVAGAALHEVVLRSRRHRLQAQIGVGSPGEDHDRHRGHPSQDRVQRLEAAGVGQAQVEHDAVLPLLVQAGQGALEAAGAGEHDVVAEGVAELELHQSRIAVVVLHEQDLSDVADTGESG